MRVTYVKNKATGLLEEIRQVEIEIKEGKKNQKTVQIRTSYAPTKTDYISLKVIDHIKTQKEVA